MRERVQSFLESIVILAIVLVLIQTFMEDFAVLIGWIWPVKRILVFTGFFFDLFFTVEFLSRLYTNVYNGKGGHYFFKKRGWIDFLASIPLLLLNSGPSVLALLTGGSFIFAVGSMLNVLKVIKAIRIARILRLLRVLKIFKQIKYTDSVMAQRHLAKITSIIVTLFVFILFAASIASSFIGIPSTDEIFTDKNMQTAQEVIDSPKSSLARISQESDSALLLVRDGDSTLFSRYSNDEYEKLFGPSDYQYLSVDSYHFFFDLRTLLQIQAKDNIIYFVIIVALVILLLVYYSPHFALTVTDPIHVMKKGIEDEGYNLEVKIPERYEDDDIYQLAEAYNRVFLPMKDRSKESDETKSSMLKLDDVKDILEG